MADREVVVEHGASLAKGPALIAGTLLMVFGLAALLKNNDFPRFASTFPDGDVQGTSFLGLEVNGWTAFFSLVAGGLLLFGAAQHHLAKMMSLIVGLALCACAVIAVIDGQDVLGLAAANGWTKLAFAIAGVVILLNALMPRRTREREIAPAATTTTTAAAAPRRRFGHRDPEAPVADEPRTTVADREPVTTTAADEPAYDPDAPTTLRDRPPRRA